MSGVQCSWCGVPVGTDEGFRATEPEGERKAAFCRLEHVVPWAIQGAHWEPGTILQPGEPDAIARGSPRGPVQSSHMPTVPPQLPESSSGTRPARWVRPAAAAISR